jgi:soluble lytic murein transglycosylase
MLGAPATGPAQPASCSLEGAVYAETILIAETRDYVKKVMSNAVYYAAVFEGRPQSLKSRLGLVRSRSTAGPSVDAVVAAQDR